MFLQFFENLRDFLGRVAINLIAELAINVDGLSLVDNVLQLFSAEADQGPGHALAAAVTAVLHRRLLENLQLERAEHRLQKPLAVHAGVEPGMSWMR